MAESLIFQGWLEADSDIWLQLCACSLQGKKWAKLALTHSERARGYLGCISMHKINHCLRYGHTTYYSDFETCNSLSVVGYLGCISLMHKISYLHLSSLVKRTHLNLAAAAQMHQSQCHYWLSNMSRLVDVKCFVPYPHQSASDTSKENTYFLLFFDAETIWITWFCPLQLLSSLAPGNDKY